jgi:hypothetical protein
LRQERSRLENKLAAAQAEAAQPTDKNPYEEEGDADVAGLGRQLAQVRLAIAAHQKAVSQRTEAPPAQSPEASAEAARKASLDSEWRRLVRSVVDAQSAPPPDNDTRPVRTVHVLEQPRLPSRPIKPNRPLTSVVGLLLGVAAGAVWAFSRVNLADAARKRHIALRERAAAGTTAPLQVPIAPKPEGAHPPAESTQEASDPREAIGFAATLAVPAMNEAAPGSTDAGTAPTQLAVAEPDRRALGHAQGTPEDHGPEEPGEPKKSISPAPEQRPRPGLRDMGTQRGMIDAAFVKAQTGATPESLAQRIETRPIVDVSRDRRSEPPPPADRPSTPPRSVTPPGPPSAPITQRLGSPSDPAERPSPTPSMRPSDPDKPDTSYSFVDRGWRATSKRVSSRPPSRPADRGDSAAPNAPAARSVAQRQTELRDPPIGSVHPSAATGPDDQPPHRTPPATPHAHTEAHSASNYPGATKPGWARPSPPAIAAVSEVWTKVAGPSEPVSDDVVEPRSVPPTWNKPEEAGALAPEGQLSGLCDKLIELSASSCFVVGIVGERAELQVKSQVAAALAAMLAEGTSRVLLMEANFDFPAVHRQMSVAMPNFSGFSQQMHVRTRKGDRRPWIVMRCSASLDVLAEGIVRSPGVLYSQQFAEAVSELRRYYRVIVCDGPLLGGADAKPLDAVTDGLIVVAPSQRALMNSLDRAARWFGKKQLLAAVPAVAR